MNLSQFIVLFGSFLAVFCLLMWLGVRCGNGKYIKPRYDDDERDTELPAEPHLGESHSRCTSGGGMEEATEGNRSTNHEETGMENIRNDGTRAEEVLEKGKVAELLPKAPPIPGEVSVAIIKREIRVMQEEFALKLHALEKKYRYGIEVRGIDIVRADVLGPDKLRPTLIFDVKLV